MSALVQKVLQLSAASEAAKWSELEAQLHVNQLSTSELAQVASHFAKNEQGSTKFWEQIENKTQATLNNFKEEELYQIAGAFMLTNHEINDKLGEDLTAGLQLCYEREIQRQTAKDPYFLANAFNKLQVMLAYLGFPKLGYGYVHNSEQNTQFKGTQEGAVQNARAISYKTGLLDLGEGQTLTLTPKQKQLLEEAEEQLSKMDPDPNKITFKDLLKLK